MHLKIIQLGGSKTTQPLLIHISGPQGSGKTYLGNKIKNEYGDRVIVKDLDELADEFHQQNQISNYQEFINLFIDDHQSKPLIITGLSANKCLGVMNDNDDTFYDINTNNKFYIDTDDNIILKQRFFRQIQKLNDRKEQLYNDWLKDEDRTQEKLFRFVDLSKWKTNNITCKELHKNQSYKLMIIDDVYSNVKHLLNDHISDTSSRPRNKQKIFI